jgi:hypothetical protein
MAIMELVKCKDVFHYFNGQYGIAHTYLRRTIHAIQYQVLLTVRKHDVSLRDIPVRLISCDGRVRLTAEASEMEHTDFPLSSKQSWCSFLVFYGRLSHVAPSGMRDPRTPRGLHIHMHACFKLYSSTSVTPLPACFGV